MIQKIYLQALRLNTSHFWTLRRTVFWTVFVIGILGTGAGLQAQTNGAPEMPARNAGPAPIAKFGNKFQTAMAAPERQTRIFIYRQPVTAYANPVNIYLDSRFHTALLGGGYSEFCAAPGAIAIQTGYDDAKKMHQAKESPGQSWALQAGQTLYLRVNETNPADMKLVEVAADPAQQELARTALQTHVLSRAPAAQWCAPVQTAAPVLSAPVTPGLTAKLPVPAEPASLTPAATRKTAAPRAYALQSDALFEFGKTELKTSGYNSIEMMAQQLISDFQQVERIRVVGHSDSIGKPKANRALSLARAEVVARQLRDRSVKALKGFQVEGQGEDSLLKTNCPKKLTPASKLCHAPNRRVEIIVYGARN
jgi:OOP family OmpA-OmpF porin